jgi:hypothetical protein
VDLYESLQVSGQAAVLRADRRRARAGRPRDAGRPANGRVNGQLVVGLLSQLDSLLVSEGARRRARIELERNVPHAEVVQIKNYRAKAE